MVQTMVQSGLNNKTKSKQINYRKFVHKSQIEHTKKHNMKLCNKCSELKEGRIWEMVALSLFLLSFLNFIADAID